jgi:hypothetical protein
MGVGEGKEGGRRRENLRHCLPNASENAVPMAHWSPRSGPQSLSSNFPESFVIWKAVWNGVARPVKRDADKEKTIGGRERHKGWGGDKRKVGRRFQTVNEHAIAARCLHQ